ncbi:MAG: rod-binding protein [Mariniblastus sp.]|jgi:flagellar protein FlgJ|nr:rod-binding protein [Mariniblastus sp.]|tara:strand:+ start:1313 stop:1693 length:381 start_codon:yes stop_codon:yes gene_type:complete
MNNNIGNSLGAVNLQAGQLEQLAGLERGFNARFDAEAEAAASEFESVFLSLMLKEMRNTLDSDEGGLFGGEGSDTFGGMFDMFMGQHLSESRPLGIGDAIQAHISKLSSIEASAAAIYRQNNGDSE